VAGSHGEGGNEIAGSDAMKEKRKLSWFVKGAILAGSFTILLPVALFLFYRFVPNQNENFLPLFIVIPTFSSGYAFFSYINEGREMPHHVNETVIVLVSTILNALIAGSVLQLLSYLRKAFKRLVDKQFID
jgi:hypothetical protein